MRLPLAVVLLALLGGCATAPGPAGRASTLSDLLLALDASEKMGGDPRCRSRSVSTTEVLVPVELAAQGVSGRWTERWTVDRCGVAVPYVVKFDRAPDGDLDVSMQREVSEADSVPWDRCVLMPGRVAATVLPMPAAEPATGASGAAEVV